jgi:hypothetical protein
VTARAASGGQHAAPQLSGTANPLHGESFDARPSIVRGRARTVSRRDVALSFRLDTRGRVRFVVTQLTPVCRTIGSFAISGRAGGNRVRLTPRVGRRRLGAGTYSLVARRGPYALFAVRFAVGRGRIVGAQVVPTTSADPCHATLVPGAAGPMGRPLTRRLTALATAPVARAGADPSPQRAQALGAQFANTSYGGSDRAKTRVLVAVLIAIGLLAAAAIPDELVPDSRFGDALVRRRPELALGGLVTLVAAVVGYLASG